MGKIRSPLVLSSCISCVSPWHDKRHDQSKWRCPGFWFFFFFLFMPVGYKSTMAETAWQSEHDIAQHTWKVTNRKCWCPAHFLPFSLSLFSSGSSEWWQIYWAWLGFPSSTNLCRNALSIHPHYSKSRRVSHEAQKPQCLSKILPAYSCISLPFVFTHRTIISHSVHELNRITTVQTRLYGFGRSLSTFQPKPGGSCCKYIKI